MIDKAEQLLDEWEKHAGVVENNIRICNYRKFRLSYRKAEQCSRKIQFMMRHGHTQGFLVQKQRVKALVERWNRIAEEQIKPWMDETKNKIDTIRSRKKTGRKLNKAYGFVKKAGQSVRMKAR